MDSDALTARILRRMYMYGYIGARHTSVDNLQKSLPKHERGNANDAVKKLVRRNLIILKHTTSGMHCSLNHSEIEQIEELISGFA